ncbi:MAG: type I phosphomannose isomerase catalytic subunit, partial [Oscillospiraceae bacterium]
MQPIKLSPVFKDYLWGGTKLKTDFGKVSDLSKVAESWELSTHKDGQSIVSSGDDTGCTLSQYIDKHGEKILGTKAEKFDYFPILIKFIDAKESLSIQVHPDDTYALKNEGEYGKTEMWYILDANPGAYLYY